MDSNNEIHFGLYCGANDTEEELKEEDLSELMKRLYICVWNYGYEIDAQYRYYIRNSISGGGGTPVSGGSTGGTGGTPTIGTGGSSSDVDLDSPAFDEIVDSCDNVSEQCKIHVSDIFDILRNRVKAKTIGTVQMASFQMFMDEVAKNPKIEHASSLIYYKDQDEYFLTPIEHGTENEVKFDTSRESTMAFIHSHPKDAPPSAQDLLMLLEQSMKNENVRGSIIYVDSAHFYTLYITDREKVSQLYNVIKDEVDKKTHNFRKNGNLRFVGKLFKESYMKCSWNDRYMFLMAAIIDMYGTDCLRVLQFKKGEGVVYNVTMEKQRKKISYKPIKCQ